MGINYLYTLYTSTGEFTGFLVAIIPVVSSILLDHFVGEIHSQSLPFSNFDLQDKCVKSVGFEPTGRNGVFLFEKNGGRLTQKLFENSCDLLEVTKAVFKKDIVDVCISIHCKNHVDHAGFFRVSCLSIRHILLIHIILCYSIQTNKSGFWIALFKTRRIRILSKAELLFIIPQRFGSERRTFHCSTHYNIYVYTCPRNPVIFSDDD